MILRELFVLFSNGLDPEYAVIGRVARRIWAKAIKHKYGGNERSQGEIPHQTSGRSFARQEIARRHSHNPASAVCDIR